MAEFTLPNAMINNVLCYVKTSRHTLSDDAIQRNCVSFFNDEDIKTAKKVLCDILKTEFVVRKTSKSTPNTSVAHIKDIIKDLQKDEHDGAILPKFVADSFDAFPPSWGFESTANAILSMREEICSLSNQIAELKNVKKGDDKAFENVCVMRADVGEMKLMIGQLFKELDNSSSKALREEVCSISKQMSEIKNVNTNDDRILKDVCVVKAEVSDIKLTLKNMNEKLMKNTRHLADKETLSYAGVVTTMPETVFASSPENRNAMLTMNNTNNSKSKIEPHARYKMSGNTSKTPAGRETNNKSIAVSQNNNRLSNKDKITIDERMDILLSEAKTQTTRPPVQARTTAVNRKPTYSGMCAGRDFNDKGASSGNSCPMVIEPTDKDERFQRVINKNSKRRRQQPSVKGVLAHDSLKILGATRNYDIFVGGCHIDTVESDIMEHCKTYCTYKYNCIKLETKVSWYKSFRITVSEDDREKLLSAEVWPQGVFVRKFYNARSSK